MIGDGQGKRPWVYQAHSTGLFRTLHRVSGSLLILFYLVLPWLQIGGEPVLRIDLPGRKLFLMGWALGAHDTRYLLLLLIFGGVGLGLVTALLGRLWCGWACPQTVFLEEIFRRIEYWIEGDRGARRKLDQMPWSRSKVGKKTLKWVSFTVVSVVLSLTFLGLFVDPRLVFTGRASATVYALATVFAGGLLFDLGWFREQFCNYLCPYARFQGGLTDIHSLVIGYEKERGEPRLQKGKVSLKDVLDRAGCVDCNRCVAVCPQGIDIRDGYQLECIACGHCIDACTTVLGKHNKPTLIHYTTEAKLQGQKPKILRARAVVYAGVMAVAVAAALFFGLQRQTVDVQVNRAPGTDFAVLHDGSIQNQYIAHLFNNGRQAQTFRITATGLENATVIVPGGVVTVQPGRDAAVPVMVTAPASAGARQLTFSLIVETDTHTVPVPVVFLKQGNAHATDP